MRFARWGWDQLLLYGGGCALVGGLVVFFAPGPWRFLAAVPFAGTLLVLWFFRDPERVIPTDPGIVVSPADGTVSDIETVDEPEFIGGKALRVGIFLSPLNVHVNRAPAACTVRWRKYQEGKFLKAYDEKAILQNEAAWMGIEVARRGGGEPVRMIVRQVVGAVARRIVCPVEPGHELERGERYGMIKFGSRTELWVPADAGFEVRVAIGDTVKGGSTVLGPVAAID